jgi:hypothetical protein
MVALDLGEPLLVCITTIVEVVKIMLVEEQLKPHLTPAGLRKVDVGSHLSAAIGGPRSLHIVVGS